MEIVGSSCVLMKSFKSFKKSYEIVFVDDDSSDKTAELVREIAKKDARVRCIQRINRNFSPEIQIARRALQICENCASEIIRLAGRHEDNPFVRVVMAPGLALQWMTTKQPDESQIEVAIAALDRIIELEPVDAPPVKGVEVMA